MKHIGLLGFGVVGGGVWALCAPRDDLNVKRVLLRSPKEGCRRRRSPSTPMTFSTTRNHRHGGGGHGRAAPGL